MAKASVVALRNPRTERGYWGIFQVDTTWQTYEVASMMSRVMATVSGPSLAEFLETMVNPYMQDEIINRFAYEGDSKSGNWPPLAESTQRIREALGYDGSGPINERTGELMEFVMYSREQYMGEDWAAMDIPGDPANEAIADKLRHAQMGAADNGLFPGAYTPPRPVLAVNADDMETILMLLEVFVIQQVAVGL